MRNLNVICLLIKAKRVKITILITKKKKKIENRETKYSDCMGDKVGVYSLNLCRN